MLLRQGGEPCISSAWERVAKKADSVQSSFRLHNACNCCWSGWTEVLFVCTSALWRGEEFALLFSSTQNPVDFSPKQANSRESGGVSSTVWAHSKESDACVNRPSLSDFSIQPGQETFVQAKTCTSYRRYIRYTDGFLSSGQPFVKHWKQKQSLPPVKWKKNFCLWFQVHTVIMFREQIHAVSSKNTLSTTRRGSEIKFRFPRVPQYMYLVGLSHVM